MKYPLHTLLPAMVFTTSLTPATADWQSAIGFTRLQQLAGPELPTAPGQGLTQVEASSGGNFEPDTSLYPSKTFSHKSGTSGVSDHATHVATNFFGTASQLPGSCNVDLYSANSWLYSGFLRFGTSSAPYSESRAVQNHSWIGGFTEEGAAEIGQRLDYAINNDGFVSVVGVNNNFSTTLPAILCQSYNSISVGRGDGQHSAGLTTLDGVNRMKPDLVAPSSSPEDATSWTTPIVAGSAGLLYEKLKTTYAITGASLPRVVKALLLASATKDTVPDWDHTPTAPLDSIYGAGELNVHHAYTALRTGRATASNSTLHNACGWASQSVSTNSTRTYYFNIPAGAPTTPFSAALTWHRLVSGPWGNLSSSLTDLSLRLHHASGFSLGSQIAMSDSPVDNVELIYQASLTPGNYALVVTSPPSSPATFYGLAWHSLPAVNISATVSTAREIDGQSGLITVTRSGDTTLALLVPLTVSGTAVSGAHYQPLPASLTIPAGQTTATADVVPIADSLAQGERTLLVAVADDFSLVSDAAQTAEVTIEDKPFDAWRFAHFSPLQNTNPSISGESADPDADQLPNLVEYAIGLNPESPDASPLTQLDLSGYQAISASKNPAATDITWGAEVCGDFSNWSTDVTTTTVGSTFTARDNVLMSAAEKRFIRLKITRP